MTTNKPEVKRYDIGSAFESDMWETEDGDYVEWEAYEDLQAERDALAAHVERLQRALKATAKKHLQSDV